VRKHLAHYLPEPGPSLRIRAGAGVRRDDTNHFQVSLTALSVHGGLAQRGQRTR